MANMLSVNHHMECMLSIPQLFLSLSLSHTQNFVSIISHLLAQSKRHRDHFQSRKTENIFGSHFSRLSNDTTVQCTICNRAFILIHFSFVLPPLTILCTLSLSRSRSLLVCCVFIFSLAPWTCFFLSCANTFMHLQRSLTLLSGLFFLFVCRPMHMIVTCYRPLPKSSNNKKREEKQLLRIKRLRENVHVQRCSTT